jgi:hypothetical protein
MKWNYSGWEAKSAYPDLKRLSDHVRGDFSQGRIIYENSDLSNVAGSMRVFEMLPYFAQRATLESVYMQATVLAPAAFYLQALISKTPSCPFPNYSCTSHNVSRIKDYLSLMGISDLILISSEVRSQADDVRFLHNDGDFGLWHLYKSDQAAPLVEVMKTPPEWAEFADFKKTFYQWFLDYSAEKPYLVIAPENEKAKITAAVGGDCHPKLTVDFNRLDLETDCPGKFHVLKFAYHSTWKASTGDEIFLTSPGFIGLIPSAKKMTLTWGQHWLWILSDALSWLSFLGMIGFLGWKRVRGKRGSA